MNKEKAAAIEKVKAELEETIKNISESDDLAFIKDTMMMCSYMLAKHKVEIITAYAPVDGESRFVTIGESK